MRRVHEFVERWGPTAVLAGVATGLLTLVVSPVVGSVDPVGRAAAGFALGVVLGLDYGILVEWRANKRHPDDREG